MKASLCGRELIGPFALAQEAGDAEVEQLDRAVGRDEDVAGLEVAVHDQVLVGVLDRRTDLAQELEPRAQRELVRGSVVGDRTPVDVLHDDVGLPVGRDAAIEEGGDVLVIEVGEDLALKDKKIADGMSSKNKSRGQFCISEKIWG